MEILSTSELITGGWLAALMGVGLFGVIVLLVIAAYYESSWRNKRVIAVLVSISVASLVFVMIGLFNYDTYTQHKVIVNDMSVFDFERYEIIAQDGRILTVIEAKGE